MTLKFHITGFREGRKHVNVHW